MTTREDGKIKKETIITRKEFCKKWLMESLMMMNKMCQTSSNWMSLKECSMTRAPPLKKLKRLNSQPKSRSLKTMKLRPANFWTTILIRKILDKVYLNNCISSLK